MGQIIISGNTYEVYGTEASATAYLLGHPRATTWTSASAIVRQRAQIQVARIFDVQPWVGTITDPLTPQPLAWPRTGVTDREGIAVDPGVIPQDILDGSYEWALQIVRDLDIAEATPGTNTKRTRSRVKVDVIEEETERELFRPTIGQVARFPLPVHELVGFYLSGGGLSASFVAGTDAVSGFRDVDTDFGFTGGGLDGGSNA